MLVYKYQKIDEWFYKNLINMEIFCNSPENFNDPFDCMVEIINNITGDFIKRENNFEDISFSKGVTVEKLIEDFKKIKKEEEKYKYIKFFENINFIKKITDLLKKEKNNLYISCFTTKNDNELMWAHYADSHKGICINYKINDNELVEVKYEDDYSEFLDKWLRELFNLKKNKEKNNIFKVNKLINEIYSIKSNSWEYESEWRLIQYNQNIKEIDNSQIKSIYFGLKTDENNIKTIIKILKNLEIDIPLYKMEKVGEKFLLEPKLLNKDLYK